MRAQVAGDTNVVIVGWNDATSTIQSVTDTGGNTYKVGAAIVRGAGMSQAIYYAANIKAAASNKVTIVFSQSVSYPDIRILEYGGLDPSVPFDVAASASGSSGTASSGSVTTGTTNELLVGGGTTKSYFSDAGANYTKRVITNPDGDIAEDRVVGAGTNAATAPLGIAGQWVMQVAAFRPSGGGGGSTTTTAGTTTTSSSTTTTTTVAGDPRATTGQWTAPVNYGSAAGIMQHSILIPGTSKILFFEDGAGTYVLDTSNGSFAAQTAANNLFCAGQTVLADGRIMTLGGDLDGEPAAGLPNTNIYNPASNSWATAAPMNYLRWYPTATKLPDGRILATSGTASNVIQGIPEVYNPAANTWTAVAVGEQPDLLVPVHDGHTRRPRRPGRDLPRPDQRADPEPEQLDVVGRRLDDHRRRIRGRVPPRQDPPRRELGLPGHRGVERGGLHARHDGGEPAPAGDRVDEERACVPPDDRAARRQRARDRW